MTTPTKQHAASKVLTMAEKMVDQRQVVRVAPPGRDKRRQVGRYEKTIDNLQEAVLEYRLAGTKVSPP